MSPPIVHEVFVQWKNGAEFVHVGEVEAPNHETALLAAKEHFARRESCSALWVVARSDIHASRWDESVLAAGSKKRYRRSLGGSGNAEILIGRI